MDRLSEPMRPTLPTTIRDGLGVAIGCLLTGVAVYSYVWQLLIERRLRGDRSRVPQVRTFSGWDCSSGDRPRVRFVHVWA